MSCKLSQVVGGDDLRFPLSRLDCCRSVTPCWLRLLDALRCWLKQLPSACWMAETGALGWSRRRQWNGSCYRSRGLQWTSDLCHIAGTLQDTRPHTPCLTPTAGGCMPVTLIHH